MIEVTTIGVPRDCRKVNSPNSPGKDAIESGSARKRRGSTGTLIQREGYFKVVSRNKYL